MRTRISVAVGAASLLAASVANATLVSTDGGLGVYDTVNNVTWTSDANLFATQFAASGGAVVSAIISDWSGHTFADGYTLSSSDFPSNGFMTWWGAQAWVNHLNATKHGNSTHWALPTTVDSESSAGEPDGALGNPAHSSSQLATLFYGGLGQVAGYDIATTHNAAYGLFSHVQSDPSSAHPYWSGTKYSADPQNAWGFLAAAGAQFPNLFKRGFDPALAVSPGQVSAVPLPGAAWLLGSGLLRLVGLSRRR